MVRIGWSVRILMRHVRPLPLRGGPASRVPVYAGTVAALVVAAPLCYLGFNDDARASSLASARRGWEAASAWAAEVSQIDASDLMSILPAYADFRHPDGSGGTPKGRLASAGVALSRPPLTVVLSWDGICAATLYDAKTGHTTIPRPGLAALLLALADADAEVVIWAGAVGAASAAESFNSVVKARVMPADAPRVRHFRGFLAERWDRVRAMDAAAAQRESRAPTPPPPLDESDYDELYVAAVLRVGAVLGREHCVGAPEGRAVGEINVLATPLGVIRPVPLIVHDRSAWDVLVVGACPPSAFGLSNDVSLSIDTAADTHDAAAISYLHFTPYAGASDTDSTLVLLAHLIRQYTAWRRLETGADAGAGASADAGAGASVREPVSREDRARSIGAFLEKIVASAAAEGNLRGGSLFDPRVRARAALLAVQSQVRREEAGANEEKQKAVPLI